MIRKPAPYKTFYQLIIALFFLFAFSPKTTLAGDVLFQLNERGLTLLSENQFKLGPFSLFFSPWLYTEQKATSFGLKEAGLDLAIGRFHLTVGRQLQSFGPGRYAFPILNPLGEGLTAEGLDQLSYSFATKKLNYKKIYAWVPATDFRLLLGQRATYDLGPLTFGFTETALARENIPGFYYLPLPFIPVGLYQAIAEHCLDLPEANQALNLLAQFDLTLRLWSGLQIYAGYLIDSQPFPYLQDGSWQLPARDSSPWKVGYQCGAEWDRPLGLKGIKFYTEYTRINQFTYTHNEPFFNYTYKGQLLGGPLGPDADQLNLELTTTNEGPWQYGFAFSRQRKGEGRIGDEWTYQPGQTAVFLTGVVETTDRLVLSATKYLGVSDQVTLSLSLSRIANAGRQSGAISFLPEIAVLGKVSWK